MKPKTIYTKMDIIVTAGCVVFLLVSIGAVGPGGQRHAKEMLCLSQLQKWGAFSQDYLNDNGGYFPKGWWEHDTALCEDYWMEAFRQYYGGSDKLRCCPEATVPGSEIGGSQWGGNGVFTAWGVFESDSAECGEPYPLWPFVSTCDYGSYGMNGFLCNPPSDVSFIQGRPTEYNWRTGNVVGADNIPLFTDSQWIDQWPHHMDEPPEYDGQPWGDDHLSHMLRVCINRHRGYVGSGFLDGSARKVGLKELWTLKWHRQYDTCGPWTVCGGIQPSDWPEWMQEFEDY
jgi:hypothetical protein